MNIEVTEKESEPVDTEPVVIAPVDTEPVVTEPVVTEPVDTEPVVIAPVVTEPVVNEPVVNEPVVTPEEEQASSSNGDTKRPLLVDIPIDNESTALNLLVGFLSVAQRRGSFSFKESAKIGECIDCFTMNNTNKN